MSEIVADCALLSVTALHCRPSFLLQAAVYVPLNRAKLDVWEALGALDSLREYETALLGDDDCDPSLGLKEHALQTAEACRWAAVTCRVVFGHLGYFCPRATRWHTGCL